MIHQSEHLANFVSHDPVRFLEVHIKKINSRSSRSTDLRWSMSHPFDRVYPIWCNDTKHCPMHPAHRQTLRCNSRMDFHTGGSASTVRIFLFFSFKYMLTPAKVPPVPVLITTASTLPSKKQHNLPLGLMRTIFHLFVPKSPVPWKDNDQCDSLDYQIDLSTGYSPVAQHTF